MLNTNELINFAFLTKSYFILFSNPSLFSICFHDVNLHIPPPLLQPNLINNSEDYYGDLDLKSIRKSELLAGLANADSRGPAKKNKNQN